MLWSFRIIDCRGQKMCCTLLWDKAKDFLQRAFTVIFLATILIWFLQNFDTGPEYGIRFTKQYSCAFCRGSCSYICHRPVLETGGYVTALISGFMAKESVVSSLTVLFGSTEALQSTLTAVGAGSLLVFCLLYTPCVAAIASVKRELGGKWATLMVIGQCVIAWLAAFAVYQIGMFL